ncbi:MAG: glycoside hydrolase family 13 protein [Clostridia bacterium]|nr:glycoside hydrolase family 13 protein [Clostridia bacterium]
MLPKFHSDTDLAACAVTIKKHVSGKDASHLGAFSFGTHLDISLYVPRTLGSRAVVLRLYPDDLPCELPYGEHPLRGADDPAYTDLPLIFKNTDSGMDEYTLTLDTSALCGDRHWGLYYYEFLFLRGFDTLFTNSLNNVDFTLTGESASKFRLLIYEENFDTPHWFRGGVMYHIFVDRFCRGAGPVTLRPGTELDEDWDGGHVQYNAYPGAPLTNNRFFGGNLWGIIEKLDTLRARGVTTLYLSPIFDAASNHKYDTGDYERVDPFFGGEAALQKLLAETRKRDMHVILDGVFNHTGDDSRYFNRYGNYQGTGAYQSPDSPYVDWYSFREHPDSYECWWDIPILPRLDGRKAAVRDYFTAEDGIVPTRIRQGISGWRLDVADELTGEFLDQLRANAHKAAKANGEQPLIIGEVWENAADKIAYGKRRRYFSGRQLDSVMNYPLRHGIIALVRDGDATLLYDTLTELYSSYPTSVCHCLMNLLGTHDTERILTVLGDPNLGDDRTNEQLSTARLTDAQYALAVARLKIAATVLYTVFGVPSVFYGDDVGMQGHHDPFCRLPYPWGREDSELLAHFTRLGELRAQHAVFVDGDFRILAHTPCALMYARTNATEQILLAVNGGDGEIALPLPAERTYMPIDLSGEDNQPLPLLCDTVHLMPHSCLLLHSEGGAL